MLWGAGCALGVLGLHFFTSFTKPLAMCGLLVQGLQNRDRPGSYSRARGMPLLPRRRPPALPLQGRHQP